MLHIDGSQGEGGGQIVRSSLALALVTGTPVTISRIRAGREKPGLMRQHLTAVRAAMEVSQAEVHGNGLGSSRLSFRPTRVQAGEYTFDVGSAGSTTLVLQTILPALLLAEGPSRISLRGGTHNLLAPPFEFLERAYLPLVNRLGPRVTATLTQYGFYPAGGGECQFEIEPAAKLTGFDLLARGESRRQSARAIVSNLSRDIATRELDVIARESGWDQDSFAVEVIRGPGPGNVVQVELGYEHVTELFTGFGKRGVRAENVAENVWSEVQAYLATDVPVGPYLADQLLLPLGLAAHFGSPGSFRTLPLTRHSVTHVEILRRFLKVHIEVEESASGATLRFQSGGY